jgi:hypothetical protein
LGLDPKEDTMKKFKRSLAACLVALLAIPAAAAATFPKGDPAMREGLSPSALVNPGTAQTPATHIVREVRVVTHGGDSTVAIALSAAALGIALGGTAYIAMRLRPVARTQRTS